MKQYTINNFPKFNDFNLSLEDNELWNAVFDADYQLFDFRKERDTAIKLRRDFYPDKSIYYNRAIKAVELVNKILFLREIAK